MRKPLCLLVALCITLALSACKSGSSGGNASSGGPSPAACASPADNSVFVFPGNAASASQTAADNAAGGDLNRYEMANACWVLKAMGNGKYVVANNTGYAATADTAAEAERFYMKPTVLGSYLFYNANRKVMMRNEAALSNAESALASDAAEWTVLAEGDESDYPPTPAYHTEPEKEQVTAWHDFVDPDVRASSFTISSPAMDRNLAIDGDGNLAVVMAGADPASDLFSFEPASGCAVYPEAQSNVSGRPFRGTRPDGTVLGHADVHVHISATEFLGGAQWGRPFHKFGVEHALGNCAVQHGSSGHLDLVGGAFTQDFDGHATDGWPIFEDWPSRNSLTHEAIYWKWIERAWAGGLRVIVNDLVDNQTLCELQRNAVNDPAADGSFADTVASDPAQDCNSMNNAGRQAGTMYALENYIDAQYGGPGKGFFQIVHSPAEARAVIEDGKIAVVLGIEISNLFNCQLTYSPVRQKESHEEPADGSGSHPDLSLPTENRYNCTTDEDPENDQSIKKQMERVHGWGVRQIISIHEFDNAFGGNGIFDGLILNLGNRENSGGIPSGDIASLAALFEGTPGKETFDDFVNNLQTAETPTGEWWTTYDCPTENETPNFSGYLWGDSGGSTQLFPDDGVESFPEEGVGFFNQLLGVACVPSGQGGRAGGKTPCYPAGVPQCNARWMTPAGLYTFSKLMEMGFLIDWDHMELGMKTQLLELAEAQDPVYPFVSTHGTFGGTTIDQATRMLANGGFLYPSNGSSGGFLKDMDETVGIYQAAMAKRQSAGLDPLLFGFGYGTDTNGLSAQSGPRNNPDRPVVYPFTLFRGAQFNTLPELACLPPVTFNQPNSTDAQGTEVRTWHEDIHGNAHYGMLSDFVQEIVLDGAPEQVRHLFNSAEAYLQTWERAEAAKAAILNNGGLKPPAKAVLRPSPNSGPLAPLSYCDAIGGDC